MGGGPIIGLWMLRGPTFNEPGFATRQQDLNSVTAVTSSFPAEKQP